MGGILAALLAITILFFVFLAARSASKKLRKLIFCAVCMAVSLTWITLLALYYLGIFQNQLLIALFMGETVLGVFYLARDRFGKSFELFQLPLLLTLITAAYLLLSIPGDLMQVAALLALLWAVFLLVFLSRKNRRLRLLVRELINCCRQI